MGGKGLGSIEQEVQKHPGVEIHGKTLRIWFMFKGQRCRETLGVELTKANVRQAANMRAAILHDIKFGAFDYARYFPNSPRARSSPTTRSISVKDLRSRYWEVKLADITEGTERRYSAALDACLKVIGPDLMTDTLLPEDADRLRTNLIATRKPSTVNHYLATWNGLAAWGKRNGYLNHNLIAAFFDNESDDPDPLTMEEFELVVKEGCIHPQDVALVTLAVYSGLRPGEMCALAREDVDGGKLHVRRALTDRDELKVTKTGKSRTILLLPPARAAVDALIAMTKNEQAMDEQVAVSRHQSRTERLTPLVTPMQSRNKSISGRRLKPASWGTKWGNLVRRSGIRYRRVYQTRHTFACWGLTAHGNIAFIANQLGHKDYSMLVKIYGRWMDSESEKEADFVWQEMQKTGAFAPKLESQ